MSCHNALCHSGHKWWNYDFPYSADFTLYPFQIIQKNVQALHGIPFGDYSAEMYLFPGISSLLQFFLSHSHNKMVYDLGAYLHCYPFAIFMI